MNIENCNSNDTLSVLFENLPTLLQKPVALLTTLPCVAGIISGLQQDDTTTFLRIDLIGHIKLSQALKCFKDEGLKVLYLNIDPATSSLALKIANCKSILN